MPWGQFRVHLSHLTKWTNSFRKTKISGPKFPYSRSRAVSVRVLISFPEIFTAQNVDLSRSGKEMNLTSYFPIMKSRLSFQGIARQKHKIWFSEGFVFETTAKKSKSLRSFSWHKAWLSLHNFLRCRFGTLKRKDFSTAEDAKSAEGLFSISANPAGSAVEAYNNVLLRLPVKQGRDQENLTKPERHPWGPGSEFENFEVTNCDLKFGPVGRSKI